MGSIMEALRNKIVGEPLEIKDTIPNLDELREQMSVQTHFLKNARNFRTPVGVDAHRQETILDAAPFAYIRYSLKASGQEGALEVIEALGSHLQQIINEQHRQIVEKTPAVGDTPPQLADLVQQYCEEHANSPDVVTFKSLVVDNTDTPSAPYEEHNHLS